MMYDVRARPPTGDVTVGPYRTVPEALTEAERWRAKGVKADIRPAPADDTREPIDTATLSKFVYPE